MTDSFFSNQKRRRRRSRIVMYIHICTDIKKRKESTRGRDVCACVNASFSGDETSSFRRRRRRCWWMISSGWSFSFL